MLKQFIKHIFRLVSQEDYDNLYNKKWKLKDEVKELTDKVTKLQEYKEYIDNRNARLKEQIRNLQQQKEFIRKQKKVKNESSNSTNK